MLALCAPIAPVAAPASSTSTLANGLVVEVTELPHLHSATVSLAVRCGSRHETLRFWGLSHLLEHMLFRGSQRYPSAERLALAFEQAGATLEAETWRDHTYLSATTHPSRLQAIIVALADLVIAPRFDDLDIERRIVEAELQAELNERGQDVDLNNISRSQVWRQHPMGRRIVGSVKSLRKFTFDDLRAHHGQFYRARNAILSVAGPVTHTALAPLVTDCFGPMQPGAQVVPATSPQFAPKSYLCVRPHAGSQVSLQMTFEALSDGHPDFLAQTLLANILDDGMTSRLQRAVCEQRGLVYTLTSGLDCYTDCGLYDIEMAVAPRRAATAVIATLDTLKKLLQHGVTENELHIARERSLHALEFQADAPVDLAQARGVGRLLGTPYDAAQEAQRLHSITREDIDRVAACLFGGKSPHITVMGPTHRANLGRIERSVAKFAS